MTQYTIAEINALRVVVGRQLAATSERYEMTADGRPTPRQVAINAEAFTTIDAKVRSYMLDGLSAADVVAMSDRRPNGL
jgi:hypothetical protein